MNYLHNPMQPQHQPHAFAPVAIEMTPQKTKPQQHGRTTTKLPDQWAKDKDADGNAYYYHEQNGQTLWEAPPGSVQVPDEVVQQHIRTKTKLPEFWMKDTDANGQSYYYHATSGATAWEAPPGSVGGSADSFGGAGGAVNGGAVNGGAVMMKEKRATVMPEGWKHDLDANLDKFYVAPSGAVQWEKPPGN